MAKTKNVESFRNYNFESCDVPQKYWGDYPHVNFFNGEFIPVLKKEFKNLAKKMGAELVSFKGGHFISSAFFKKGNKYVFVSLSDVRYNSNWFERILYRSARDEKDYTGGGNHYCSYDKLGENLEWCLE